MKNIKVFLHGILAKEFRSEFPLCVSTPREAIKAIDMNTGKRFKKFLIERKNIFYQVIIGKDSMFDDRQLDAQIGDAEELHIVPVIFGASANVFRVVAGAVLVVAGVVLAYVSFGTGTPLSAYMVAAGVGLAIGGLAMLVTGVIGLLSPQPTAQKEEAKSGGRSFLLDPSINIISNGDPIPLGYGRLIIPGISIDNYIETEDIDG
jgi:predicted phage tail protein